MSEPPCRTDPGYVRSVQYQTDRNLSARIALHRQFSTNPKGLTRWLFERFDLTDACRMLEVGCGTGQLWSDNGERIPPGWQMTLTDVSSGMISSSRAKLQHLGCQVTLGVADVTCLPFAAGLFDAVIANYMLYHVGNRSQALAEMDRVLHPSGTFFAATNGRDHMRELDSLIWPGLDVQRRSHAATEFTLENGSAQLNGWFAEVNLDIYPDRLEVTEVEPIMAYIQSIDPTRNPDDQAMERIRQAVEREIKLRGSFPITKSTGLFRCAR